MNPIKIKLASTESELFEIKNLQRINLKGNLSESEKKSGAKITLRDQLLLNDNISLPH